MKEYGFKVKKDYDEDYDLKEFIFYRFGYGPVDAILKRVTGITTESATGNKTESDEIATLSPKEIFEEYKTEKRHKKELEDLIDDARKRCDAKKVENNKAPKVSNTETSKKDESRDTISVTSDLSLTKTTSLISISSQGSSVEIIEPVVAPKSNTPTQNDGVVHDNLVSIVQAPTSSAPTPVQSNTKPEESSITTSKPRSLMPSRKSKLIFDGLKSDPKAFRKMIKKSNSSEETSKSQPTPTPTQQTPTPEGTSVPDTTKSTESQRSPEKIVRNDRPNKQSPERIVRNDRPNERSESEWSKMVRQQLNNDPVEKELVIGIDQSGGRKVKCPEAKDGEDRTNANSPVKEPSEDSKPTGRWKPVQTSPEKSVTENVPIRSLLNVTEKETDQSESTIEKPMEISTPPRKIILPGSLGELVAEPKSLSISVRKSSTDDRIVDSKIEKVEEKLSSRKSKSATPDLPGEPVYSSDDQSEKPWLENISSKSSAKPKKSKKSKKEKKSKKSKSKERRIVQSDHIETSTSGSEVIPDDEEGIILVPDEEENDELEVEMVTSGQNCESCDRDRSCEATSGRPLISGLSVEMVKIYFSGSSIGH